VAGVVFSELALLLFDLVHLLMYAIELAPYCFQQLVGVVGRLRKLAKMMLQVLNSLAAAGKWSARHAHDIDFVLQLGEQALPVFECSTQLERLAEQRSDERLEVKCRRRFDRRGRGRRRRLSGCHVSILV
jgi:hypothetical protein